MYRLIVNLHCSGTIVSLGLTFKRRVLVTYLPIRNTLYRGLTFEAGLTFGSLRGLTFQIIQCFYCRRNSFNSGWVNYSFDCSTVKKKLGSRGDVNWKYTSKSTLYHKYLGLSLLRLSYLCNWYCHCRYQGYISAALVLGGVDVNGPHLYSIYPHGSTDSLPYVTMGSGSLAAMAVFEDGYKVDMEVIRFPAVTVSINITL